MTNMGQAVGNTQIGEMSFWEHLDVLRASLIKIAITTVLCGIVAFLFKEEVFSVILAPKSDTFISYRLFSHIAEWTTGTYNPAFSVQLINTGLAEQFVIHMKTSIYIGFLLSSPYSICCSISYLLHCMKMRRNTPCLWWAAGMRCSFLWYCSVIS